jgi:hypothetical protein
VRSVKSKERHNAQHLHIGVGVDARTIEKDCLGLLCCTIDTYIACTSGTKNAPRNSPQWHSHCDVGESGQSEKSEESRYFALFFEFCVTSH